MASKPSVEALSSGGKEYFSGGWAIVRVILALTNSGIVLAKWGMGVKDAGIFCELRTFLNRISPDRIVKSPMGQPVC